LILVEQHEVIEKHEEYIGKRVKRGLFKTKKGLLLNADVNGSLNIMKKNLNVASDELITSTCRGFVFNPLRIASL